MIIITILEQHPLNIIWRGWYGADYISSNAAIYGRASYILLLAGQRRHWRSDITTNPPWPSNHNGYLGKALGHNALPASWLNRLQRVSVRIWIRARYMPQTIFVLVWGFYVWGNRNSAPYSSHLWQPLKWRGEKGGFGFLLYARPRYAILLSSPTLSPVFGAWFFRTDIL